MSKVSSVNPYNRDQAVAYAHKWALSRNPAYYDYNAIGGDCTNFASQVVFSGSNIMNYSPNYGWFYINANNKSASWTGVEFLYNFITNNKIKGPFAEEVDVKDIMPGDLVQLSFNGEEFHHTPVVVQTGSSPSVDNILICAHTFDCDNRKLSSYHWDKIRFIHINGVRI